jgi:exosortase C (VPDSG-CTERM-specific)
MHDPNQLQAEKNPLAPAPAGPRRLPLNLPARFWFGTLAVIACFALPLVRWAEFSFESGLYSYMLLVPIVSAYLFSLNQGGKHGSASSFRTRPVGAALVVLGLAALGGVGWVKFSCGNLTPQDETAFTILPFVLLLSGACAWTLKPAQFKGAVFPLAFLLFMVPFPVAVEQGIEFLLQHGSAPPAHWLFSLAGTTVFNHDLIFQLPGITLQVAPECSGIRSTLVLFMSSMIAGFLFLRSPRNRIILTVFVIPLALLRNGFRIFTIGELCVRIGPHMIDSVVHHRGGPIFFALSLIPFFFVLFFLVRLERRHRPAPTPVATN